MLSVLTSIAAESHFLVEVGGFRILFHCMHGRVGYSFAE